MSTLNITPMLREEAQTVSDMITSIIQSLDYYNDRARLEEINKYSSAKLIESIIEGPDSILVARDAEEMLGFCISRYDDGLIWLAWFGVKPNCRHKGIGGELLIALDKTADRRRAHKVWCDTRTVNLKAQSVLQKAGYTKIAELKNHWYGQDFFLWEKLP
jgi:ribosomal protein S18 acetylase RimI-like enzyme